MDTGFFSTRQVYRRWIGLDVVWTNAAGFSDAGVVR